jgi:hypothetical protein
MDLRSFFTVLGKIDGEPAPNTSQEPEYHFIFQQLISIIQAHPAAAPANA